MEKTISKLPTELTSLVNESLDLLGQATRMEFGDKVFKEVERVRRNYKAQRASQIDKKLEAHRINAKHFKSKAAKEKLAIAHSFATSLELINACENAYRSHRLAQTPNVSADEKLLPIIFVLTAHPTEARSAKAIELLDKIGDLLRVKLREKHFSQRQSQQLFHLIILLIKTPLSKVKSPSVQDEAEYIYSIILKKQNIEKLCDYYDKDQPVFIRTWVGGDKDGHPGVDAVAMLGSLSQSRKKLIPYVRDCIDLCHKQLVSLEKDSKPMDQLCEKVLSIGLHLKALHKLGDGDGIKLNRLYKTLDHVKSKYIAIMGTQSPELDRIETLLKVFPGLVVPLELREDSGLIQEAIFSPKMEIIKMIKTLRRLSKSGKASWYVRGLVISMCESEQDVRNAISLLKKNLGGLHIPIVPLFETRAALEASAELTKQIFAIADFRQALEKTWDKKYEVMVGYSDSAKESGALFSRVIIEKSLTKLDRLVRSKGCTPIFFHGSGGSVARGGGSLKEQMAWWPRSAQLRYKATIQGEMIHRTFSTVEIFERQVSKIRQSIQKPRPVTVDTQVAKSVYDFAEQVRLSYFGMVTDTEFMNVVSQATPYPYLDQLKIGSRPSKRKNTFDLNSLRAIPWVLCWTQTRVLFPVWWGVGQSWNQASSSEKALLRKAFRQSSLFSSYVGMLAYTLAKTDLSVWAFYLESSEVEAAVQLKYLTAFKKELRDTQNFLHDVTGKKDLLWFRPWLVESIKLRSTLIYPLNILEVEALQTQDMPLLRETVTGVASGMLTTG